MHVCIKVDYSVFNVFCAPVASSFVSVSQCVCGCVCFVAPTTRILLVRVVGAEHVLKSCSANLRGLDLGCIEAKVRK